MTQALAPCPSCSRHVEIREKACPFCKSELPGTLSAIPGATHRLTRAAAYAFTASLAVAGCSAGIAAPTTDGGTDEGGSTSGGTSGGTSDSGKKDGAIPDFDSGGVQPPYGAPAYGGPPPFDSGAGD